MKGFQVHQTCRHFNFNNLIYRQILRVQGWKPSQVFRDFPSLYPNKLAGTVLLIFGHWMSWTRYSHSCTPFVTLSKNCKFIEFIFSWHKATYHHVRVSHAVACLRVHSPDQRKACETVKPKTCNTMQYDRVVPRPRNLQTRRSAVLIFSPPFLTVKSLLEDASKMNESLGISLRMGTRRNGKEVARWCKIAIN